MPAVSIKWQGKKFDLDVDTALEPLVFKSQLFELTGVVPERQKIVFKGKTLKEDSWDGINLVDGSLLMMLGSVEALLEPLKVSGDSEQSFSKGTGDGGEAAIKMPCGLTNLGNTCYMNATLQSLRVIPELAEGIQRWTNSGPQAARPEMRQFFGSISTLFNDMNTSGRETYMPMIQVGLMHQLYPQFATQQPGGGGYEQQDANELLTELIREFSEVSECEIMVGSDKKTIPVKNFIEGHYLIRMKNTEDPEEPVQESFEAFMQLSCFLDTPTPVRYLQIGISDGLTEEIEKHSEKLSRNCKYQKETRISRLPSTLVVQMVRFCYKEKEKINAKILKDVKFPIILDAFDFCTPDLQRKLMPQREAHKEYEDKQMEKKRLAKLEDDNEIEKAPDRFLPTSFSDDLGSNNSGFYELKAVITHKGRASNSGHYIAWVRVKGSIWACCDDDYIHPVSEEDILKLSGGGDYHTAYILVYGPRPTPVFD